MAQIATWIPKWLEDWSGQDWRNYIVEIAGGVTAIAVVAWIAWFRGLWRRRGSIKLEAPVITVPSDHEAPLSGSDLGLLEAMYAKHRSVNFRRVPGEPIEFVKLAYDPETEKRADEFYFAALRLEKAGLVGRLQPLYTSTESFYLSDPGIQAALKRASSLHLRAKVRSTWRTVRSEVLPGVLFALAILSFVLFLFILPQLVRR